MKIIALMACAAVLAVVIPVNGSPAPPPDLSSEVQRLKLEARTLRFASLEVGEAIVEVAAVPPLSQVGAPVTPEPNSRLHPWDFG